MADARPRTDCERMMLDPDHRKAILRECALLEITEAIWKYFHDADLSPDEFCRRARVRRARFNRFSDDPSRFKVGDLADWLARNDLRIKVSVEKETAEGSPFA